MLASLAAGQVNGAGGPHNGNGKNGANGQYDTYFKQIAQGLKDNGLPNAIIRLGWEFNGSFYPWAAGGKEAEFAAYWRRIVDTMRPR